MMMEVWLTCYLVLLSVDNQSREQVSRASIIQSMHASVSELGLHGYVHLLGFYFAYLWSSHYLNQWYIVINEIPRNTFTVKFRSWNVNLFYFTWKFKRCVMMAFSSLDVFLLYEMANILSKPEQVNSLRPGILLHTRFLSSWCKYCKKK